MGFLTRSKIYSFLLPVAVIQNLLLLDDGNVWAWNPSSRFLCAERTYDNFRFEDRRHQPISIEV